MDFLAACALLLRAIIATYPHSGMGSAPLHGDLEAQRHWMEVTLHLPIGDWYRDTAENDLLYWGLDYPPLTAFGSWLFAAVGQRIAPQAVAWESSRGAEDPATIAFMRGTVLAADALVFLPAAWIFARTAAPEASRAPLFAALAFLPPLIIIDHGHFQYNGVSLGLAVFAVAAAARGWHLTAAAAFSGALNYKQMLLYFAPTWFVYLLAESWRPYGSVPVTTLAKRVAAIGVIVVLVFSVSWFPFCIWAAPLSHEGHGRENPTLTSSSCAAGLGAVLSRLFPFGRSLFEDKVANVWCALEPVLKLRERTYADATGLTRRVAVGAATFLTAAMMAPALAGLWSTVTCLPQGVRGNPLTSMGGAEALSQTKDYVAGDRASRPLLDDGTATTGLRARKAQRRSSRGGPGCGAGGIDGGPRGDPKLTTVDDAGIVKSATASEPLLWASWEVLLLALHAVALSFFLASYQVHEKTVLLPLLPAVMLRQRVPLLATWMSGLALWSLWPLLCRDGLLAPVIILGTGYAAAFWPSAEAVEKGDAVLVARGLQVLGWRYAAGVLTRWLRILAAASALPALAISMCAATLAPPARLPDTYPFVTAVYACALLLAAWAASSWALLSGAIAATVGR